MTDRRVVHCAMVIEYDHGALNPDDVEMAIEDNLYNVVEAKVVFVSERLHERLLDAREKPATADE